VSAPASLTRSLPLLLFALVAFAANSLLCRHGLTTAHGDPWAFTAIRLASGAAMLVLLQCARGGLRRRRLDLRASTALYVYAALFSLAYVALDAGTGALLLFAAVQLTMVGIGLWRGERPAPLAWIGLATASFGLVWMLLPKVGAPAPLAALQMLGAGAAWGLYSMYGARVRDPLSATTWNFIAACPVALIALAFQAQPWRFPEQMLIAGVLSGAGASALGYAVWYHILPRLPAMVAASAQLSVPLIAALGGAWILNEAPGARFAQSAALVLGGITCVLVARTRSATSIKTRSIPE
jgi:drug/metabolite transporter (DMT)-like permease